ncbi:FecR family protein [Mucilaginibacter sp. PAMB04274]|uniref:FecR family protein n=1 Tax=Mucilaginibacter sp. PAMB04274 TaxID=3138568 RepID=UPI0031F6F76E
MPENESSRIEILAEKLLNGTISVPEMEELEIWYAKKPAVAPTWKLNDRSKADLERRLFSQIQGRVAKPRRKWKMATAAAAVIALIGLAGTLYWQLNQNAVIPLKIASTKGGIKKIYLPDHTIVWLKGNSSLQFPAKFSNSTRNVSLQGEALFEVTKDPKHPFIIKAGQFETKVLGTSFNIQENSLNKSFKLIVLTGKVMVSSAKGHFAKKSTVIVTPEKEYESRDVTKPPVISATIADHKTQVISGTEYQMEFDNAKFAFVRKRIEQKFNVKIETGEEDYMNCNLSANVTDQSLENTLKVMCAVMSANYQIKDNIVTITGGGCN